ncbi:MAG: glucose-1-phosphate thymidylyltransferase RfbA [Bacteriovoracaceae bacterium]|nr:glucose-1-phosphate thymidylyltransferase RfbA [Bacteriovoracaceae bacterium]
MKGIILAGGAGSRLYPLTSVVTKQLQPIYDKPMIYYPLSLLMMCGIREVLIITTEYDQPFFKNLLSDGSRFGIKIQFETQPEPKGIAQAYLIGEKFLQGEDSLMVLGDNLFHGNFASFRAAVKQQLAKEDGLKAQVFAYPVTDPERYGVVEFDKKTKEVKSIVEKPEKPKSNYAIPGLYLMDGSAPERARVQKPSPRGELEITDLIQSYLDEGSLRVEVISRGMAWLDTGTPQSLLEANAYIATLEQRQGFKVACLEEIGLRMNFVDTNHFRKVISETPNSPYRDYLNIILKEYEEE